MSGHPFFRASKPHSPIGISLVAAGLVLALIASSSRPAAFAQAGSAQSDSAPCTLRNHIYTCNSQSLLKALSSASSISLETHNADGIARNALTNLVEKKLHKTLAPDGQLADLVFLLMPADDSGQVETNSTVQDLGSLRIYSTTPSGQRAHLLWAETYSGEHDLPWPIVARAVVRKFEKRFQIK